MAKMKRGADGAPATVYGAVTEVLAELGLATTNTRVREVVRDRYPWLSFSNHTFHAAVSKRRRIEEGRLPSDEAVAAVRAILAERGLRAGEVFPAVDAYALVQKVPGGVAAMRALEKEGY